MPAHRLLGGGSSSLSVSCPSLGSALIAAAHACLWSSFKRRSESPLLTHQETKRQEKVSCPFGSSRLFPGLPPGQLWRTSPFRLCSRSQPQSSPWDLTEARASAPSPHPPQRLSRQASRAGECWSAPILCAGIFPLCPPHPCGCALLRGPEASLLRHPQSPLVKGLARVWKPFLLHSSLPEEQISSVFFCLFFLLPYPGTWGVSYLLGSLTSSASVQYVFCRSCSTCRCVSDVFVGRKVISMSYSSAILKLLLHYFSFSLETSLLSGAN